MCLCEGALAQHMLGLESIPQHWKEGGEGGRDGGKKKEGGKERKRAHRGKHRMKARAWCRHRV